MLSEVFFQQVLDDDRTLAVAGNDKGTSIVVVLEVVVDCCKNVVVGHASDGGVDDPISFKDVTHIA